MKDPIMIGHTIYLRVPEEGDVTEGHWHAWYNDYETTAFNSHGVFPVSRTIEESILRENLANPTNITMAVVAKEGDELIGNISLQNIDLLHRKAEIAVTIGHKDYTGRSCALEAMGLMVEHGFSRVNLHRIYAGAHESLGRWVEMLKVFGFEKEGLLKEDFLRNGSYCDTIRFAVLEPNFTALKNQRNGVFLFESLSELLAGVSS